MKRSVPLAVILVVATLAPYGAAAAGNEPPLADAGLDQTVERGATVYLDGTGSVDPDGRIADYEWSVETPDGRTIEPANATAGRTEFAADRLGRYAVTLVVTDDEGAVESDTLYVDVERGDPPSVDVSGEYRPAVGDEVTYTASLERGAAPLSQIVWRADGDVLERRSLSGNQSVDSLDLSFGEPGRHNVSARVLDADDLSATAGNRTIVQPRSPPESDPVDRGESARPLADRHSPVVEGPELLTGEGPFDARYRIGGAPDGAVRSVTWHRDRSAAASGRTAEITWQPGDHDLYAAVTYYDGSREVASFEGGSREVVVDPPRER